MSYLSETAVYIVLFLSLVSISVGYIGARISYKLKTSSKQAMAKLKLQPNKTKKEFKVIFAINFVIITAMAIFTYGAILDDDLYRNIGRVGFILFAITMLGIKYSWWRRL